MDFTNFRIVWEDHFTNWDFEALKDKILFPKVICKWYWTVLLLLDFSLFFCQRFLSPFCVLCPLFFHNTTCTSILKKRNEKYKRWVSTWKWYKNHLQIFLVISHQVPLYIISYDSSGFHLLNESWLVFLKNEIAGFHISFSVSFT